MPNSIPQILGSHREREVRSPPPAPERGSRRANRMAAIPTTPQKLLAEVIGTACLVYIGAGSAAATGVIAAGTKVPFSMAQLGMISFAIIIVLGPATGAAINPARYLGAMTMQSAFGGTVSWSQAPAYIIGELAGGLAGALAYMGLSSTRRQAALTSLAPADTDSTVEKIA